MEEGSKLRILFVHGADIRVGGGAEKIIYYYMKMLPHEGFEPYLLMTNLLDEKRFPDSLIDELGDRVIRVKAYRPRGVAARLTGIPYVGDAFDYAFLHYYALRHRDEILEALRPYHFDIIYFVSFSMSFYFPRDADDAVWIGSEITRDFPKPRGVVGWLQYLALLHDLARFDYIHRLSNRNIGETYAGVRTFLVPSGFRSDVFYPYIGKRKDDSTVKFYFAARLIPLKGLRLLLDAWRIALEKGLSNAELHIFGTGPDSILLYKEKLPRVVYHGNFSELNLASMVREMDFLVYPTSYDTFSLTVTEALASGCHAIVSDYLRGIWDREEKLGFLEYVPRDPVILAERIMSATHNLDKYHNQELKMKQYEYMRDNYDWSRVVHKLANEIRSRVKERRFQNIESSENRA